MIPIGKTQITYGRSLYYIFNILEDNLNDLPEYIFDIIEENVIWVDEITIVCNFNSIEAQQIEEFCCEYPLTKMYFGDEIYRYIDTCELPPDIKNNLIEKIKLDNDYVSKSEGIITLRFSNNEEADNAVHDFLDSIMRLNQDQFRIVYDGIKINIKVKELQYE